jgi:thiamine kinase-like enzyme
MPRSTNSDYELDELFDKIPRLNNRVKVSELSGGLTNRNLRIQTPDGDYVARISSNTSALLSIDRFAEYENSKIAAEIGIGAPVHDFYPDFGLLIINFLQGKTFTASDVANNLPRIAESVRKLHSAQPFVSDFDMFVIQQRYLKIVQDHKFRMPDKYLDYSDYLTNMRRALAILDDGKVPCNNDLLAANFMDDGNQIWLIDYEYSGNNDACFELGNIYSESALSYEQLIELVDAYYGKHRPEKIARAWLYALLARYGWTLWASIQSSISKIEFDFWEWGVEKYETAQSDFASQQFQKALSAVTTES